MKYILCCSIFFNFMCCLCGLVSYNRLPLLRQNVRLNCVHYNQHSYYNTHAIVSNRTMDITNIYTTYDNMNTLIFYQNGSFEEHLNKTLRLVYNYDVLNIQIVSNSYFARLYKVLKDLKP